MAITSSKPLEQEFGQLWKPFAVCAVPGTDKSFRFSVEGLATVLLQKVGFVYSVGRCQEAFRECEHPGGSSKGIVKNNSVRISSPSWQTLT